MGEEFYVLGRGERSAKIEIREVDRPKESIVGDDRVKKNVDGGERSDLGGGGARGGKTVATRSAANTTVYARRVAALGAGEEERRETRRRLDSLPASLRPYIVLSIRKTM